jgi:hypothetical protein
MPMSVQMIVSLIIPLALFLGLLVAILDLQEVSACVLVYALCVVCLKIHRYSSWLPIYTPIYLCTKHAHSYTYLQIAHVTNARIETDLELLTLGNELAHQVALERGTSFAFVDSNQTRFGAEMRASRKKVCCWSFFVRVLLVVSANQTFCMYQYHVCRRMWRSSNCSTSLSTTWMTSSWCRTSHLCARYSRCTRWTRSGARYEQCV